ncbi:hypothetical protein CDD83_2107 [Cordyceps sp. RAO-2017]|nr:hypothetical protein CDD83_2107 [Cordyceps sp. RAO-2017]
MFLVKFRTWLHQFPFMHLPPDLSAQALRRERPFLWTCIMNLTSMSVAQQLVLRDKIRQEVSRKLVQNYEANMDFLLGLIVYLAWANTNSMAGVKPFFILFSQLATTIIYDMGLNRAPSEELQSSLTWRVCPLAHQDPPKSRTMEERRAVLAFWFASSITSSFVGKMDTFGWTTHMDDCLDVLDHNREQPLDEVLVALIRIQRVGEEARKLLRSDVTRDFSQGPTYVFKASLLSRLDNIRHNLSDSLQTHYAVQSQMHCVEAQVHSIAIFSGQMAPVAMRATSMYSCLKATMAWCDNLLAMPVLEVSGMTFAAYVSLSQILGILYRLTISEDPAWDRELLRSSADLPMLLGRLISLFEKVNEAYYAGLEDPDSITPFLKVSWLLRNARNTWEPAFRHYLGSSLIPPSGEAASSSTPTDPGAAAADNSQHVDMGDFAWMADILGPWELH